MGKLFKEPFVRFLLLGILLFVGNGVWERHIRKTDYQIVVAPGEMERQAIIFASENRRQPTDEDLRALLFAHVEEQVLKREAERLGLGDDDTIIRRRLAQKMRFMIEDTADMELPEEAQLKQWFKENQAKFIEPERRAFKHIFLSPEKHGDKIAADAEQVFSQINAENWKTLGDPFMLNRQFNPIDAQAVERLFGAAFAKSVFSLEDEKWQNPIESAFGLHIVKIDEIIPEKLPDFDDIRADVGRAWQDETRRAQNNERLRELIDKYDVVVEDDE